MSATEAEYEKLCERHDRLREELHLRDDVTKALDKELATLKAKFQTLQEEKVRATMDAAHLDIDIMILKDALEAVIEHHSNRGEYVEPLDDKDGVVRGKVKDAFKVERGVKARAVIEAAKETVETYTHLDLDEKRGLNQPLLSKLIALEGALEKKP